jgi:hypothetical protein
MSAVFLRWRYQLRKPRALHRVPHCLYRLSAFAQPDSRTGRCLQPRVEHLARWFNRSGHFPSMRTSTRTSMRTSGRTSMSYSGTARLGHSQLTPVSLHRVLQGAIPFVKQSLIPFKASISLSAGTRVLQTGQAIAMRFTNSAPVAKPLCPQQLDPRE